MYEVARERKRMARLSAGREMDGAVARVLGLIPCQNLCHKPDSPRYISSPCFAYPGSPMDGGECALYSTSDADALTALDAVMEKHPTWHWTLTAGRETDGTLSYWCSITTEKGWHISSTRVLFVLTRAEAICLAILNLVEEKEND